MKKNAAGLCVEGSKNPNWRGGDVKKSCEHCRSEFSVPPGRAEKARCCSLHCWNEMQRAAAPVKVKWPHWDEASALPIRERLLARSEVVESGCREWRHRLNTEGYGVVSYKRVEWIASRLAWTLWKGEIPDGLFVLHQCDNPKCINPDHLFLGTHDDNMKDMVAKGRARSGGVSREGHGMAKLSEIDVAVIRETLAGCSKKDGTAKRLAEKYGVCEATISQIKSGKTWARKGEKE